MGKRGSSHRNSSKPKGGRGGERAEIAALEARLQEKIDADNIAKFTDLPISQRTLKGATEAGFVKPTDIQRYALPRALQGADILGAAKTGSGKTLAFLIPALEKLFRSQWTKRDGAGVLVISPTRELALQTFENLRKLGKYHEFSAGLVIGGVDVEKEKLLICSTNIIICTPGRLLQHMDETPMFNCDNLQTLILDEADEILDLGFAETMNAIIANLPKKRQTMLFSATQTKSVKDLARLSLKHPEYISVHAESINATPDQLVQAYMECDLPDKLNLLMTFIKTHLNCKTIVFLSSCKQVKFVYESFRRTRPGIPLMELYGKQKQMKRVSIFKDFSKKQAAVLFATDLAARGLDFPAVDWVVQLDCPEDTDRYLHRVGRTARYERPGNGLLVLLPSEMAFVQKLEDRKVPLKKTEVNRSRMVALSRKLEALCAEDSDVKLLAQKSFMSYARSVYLQKDKDVFDVHALPLMEYALSLGLPMMPRVKFIQKDKRRLEAKAQQKLEAERAQRAAEKSDEDDSEDSEDDSDGSEDDSEDSEGGSDGSGDEESDTDSSNDEKTPQQPLTRFDRLRQKTNKSMMEREKMHTKEEDDSEEDDFLQVSKNQVHESLGDIKDDDVSTITKKKRSKLKTVTAVKKASEKKSKRVIFNEDGEAEAALAGVDLDDLKKAAPILKKQSGALRDATKDMKSADTHDKEVDRARIRERKQQRKMKRKAEKYGEIDDEDVGETMVTLGGASDYSDDDDNKMSYDGSDSDDSAQDVSKPSKKVKRGETSLAQDEDLALRLLQG